MAPSIPPSPAPENPAPENKSRPWLRRLVTWTLTILLLGYLFYTVPLERTWQAAIDAGPLVIVVTLGYFLCSYAADVIATWAIFSWFCARLELLDVISIRGATYLLALINYNLGQGGIVYAVGRKPGVGIARATGTVLLTMGVMLVSLLLAAAAGYLATPAPDARVALVGKISLAGLGALVVYLAVIVARPRFLTRHRVLEPLFAAGLGGHGRAWLVRIPHVACQLVFQWLLLRLFHVNVPLSAAVTLLPVLFVIGWIPITLQGLGTQQLAAKELLAPYVDAATPELARAQVVAFSLTLTALFTIYSAATGLAFLGRAARAYPALAAEPRA